MIICAFDPGTHCTGYGVLDIGQNSAKHIAHGTIRPKSEVLSERLKEIHLCVKTILEEYRPAEAAIETSFYAVNKYTEQVSRIYLLHHYLILQETLL